MTERRVVVTGLGAVTPLGVAVPTFWDGLLAGRSGIAPIQRFDAAVFDTRFGGECRDFDPAKLLEHRHVKRMDRFTQFAFVAAREAMNDAGLVGASFNPVRAGVIVGSGIGGLTEIEEQHMRLFEKGPSRVSAFTIPKLMANAAAGHIAIEYNCQGISAAVATACASAGSAMSDAFHTIQHGRAEIVVTGGTEAALTPLGLSAFASMKALSTRNDDPVRASRPFDRNRDGFVLSEGAGIVVFEELEHARARNAPIYCEVIGVGNTTDANDMVQPDPNGTGGARAMTMALRSAKLNPEDVSYINAHATSTPIGDVAEVRAIKGVFGAAAARMAVSSTKGATGHLLGATGGVEAIACILAMKYNVLPPTINLDEPDTECDLDFVPNTPRDARVRVAMSNSFGFGGHNSAVVFRSL
ncbi:MAG: beta-ketoacyl-ACP synthase II [Phycisphaerae bacterium]